MYAGTAEGGRGMSEDKIINLLEEGRKILEKQGKINAVMYFDKCIEKYPTEGRWYAPRQEDNKK